MVERLLKGEPEDITDEEKAQKYQVMALSSTLDKVCENCLEPGHRIWECTNKIKFKKPTVQCSICKERSHPTSDCPQRRLGSKLFYVKISFY